MKFTLYGCRTVSTMNFLGVRNSCREQPLVVPETGDIVVTFSLRLRQRDGITHRPLTTLRGHWDLVQLLSQYSNLLWPEAEILAAI